MCDDPSRSKHQLMETVTVTCGLQSCFMINRRRTRFARETSTMVDATLRRLKGSTHPVTGAKEALRAARGNPAQSTATHSPVTPRSTHAKPSNLCPLMMCTHHSRDLGVYKVEKNEHDRSVSGEQPPKMFLRHNENKKRESAIRSHAPVETAKG